MHGLGHDFLCHNFEILLRQTFKDFDVIISDQSDDNKIREVCDKYHDRLDIHYVRIPKVKPYEGQNMPVNTNNAISHADGKLIKIIYLDDYLYGDTALEDVARNFDLTKDYWMVSACTCSTDGINTFGNMQPKYHEKIYLGKNSISCPSVLTLRNNNVLTFDKNLVWLMDCDYYKRCRNAFGLPKILGTINIVNRVGPHQTSNVEANTSMREREYEYILEKYGHTKITLVWRRFKRRIKACIPVLARIYNNLRS
jgi:hypothetical protein